MNKGVVVELKGQEATMLTPDGQFLKARLDRASQIGEEITFFPIQEPENSASKRNFLLYIRPLRTGLVTAVAALLLFFIISPFLNSDEVSAYLTLDINPSFELALDSNLEVVDIQPLNNDGEKLLGIIPDWKKKTFHEVVTTIIEKSESSGYLRKNQDVLLTTVLSEDSSGAVRDLMKKQLTGLKAAIKEKDVDLEELQADMKVRDQAQEKGMSTGKFLKLQKPQTKPEKSSLKNSHVPADSQEKEPPLLPKRTETVKTAVQVPKEQQNTKQKLNNETIPKLEKTKERLQEKKNDSSNKPASAPAAPAAKPAHSNNQNGGANAPKGEQAEPKNVPPKGEKKNNPPGLAKKEEQKNKKEEHKNKKEEHKVQKEEKKDQKGNQKAQKEEKRAHKQEEKASKKEENHGKKENKGKSDQKEDKKHSKKE
ncbi:anti-sigma factor domain-containing protein [Bacillus lacus]|uniref:Anti-sigma factor domain-containing protein n=1 Tax=Metabacillus lacus TaxID=1983721 RepID=A0A7X2J100_9BACI|nr:anti-sigma factor domain-containing protein [Metabacillus lacus]MRX73284.1 anti-sigma factor domain-containing protein [Metabacillus lacus]